MTTLLIGFGALTLVAGIETSMKRKGKRVEGQMLNVVVNVAMGATIALLLYKFIIGLGTMFL